MISYIQNTLATLIVVLFILVTTTACTSWAASGSEQWEAFLASPTKMNYQPLADKINQCHTESCKTDVTPDSKTITALIDLIAHDNAQAISLAFLINPFLGGGDLEDIYRSLGVVADNDPHLFLEHAKALHLSDQHLKSIVNMMPERVIDDMAERQAATKTRIQSLSSVQDQSLINYRDKAIFLLQQDP